MTVALLGSACASSADASGEDTAAPISDEDPLRAMACSGELPAYEVCPCAATIDWSGLTEDFWGNPVDPSAFETVGLILITERGSVESVMDAICADTLTQSDVQGYVDAPAAGRTSVTLPEISFLGVPYEPKAGAVWWLEWSGSRIIGVDIEMAVLLGVVDDGPASVEVVWPP